MDDDQSARVKLITLLNADSHRRAGKRKAGQDWHAIARSAAKQAKAASTRDDGSKAAVTAGQDGQVRREEEEAVIAADDDEIDLDPYKRQFDVEPVVLSRPALGAVQAGNFRSTVRKTSTLGSLVNKTPDEGDSTHVGASKPVLTTKHKAKLDDYLQRQATPEMPKELLHLIGGYQDLLYARMTPETSAQSRAMIALHAMNHIHKTRSRVLKNNEYLAHSEGKQSSTTAEREVRDQGFTRPKVLILLPLRNAALEWMRHIANFSLASQIENGSRFQTDFSLPEGVADKLATDEKDAEGNSKYPRDHRETFKGNIDDTFRVGMKVTRKSLKAYSEFYQSDLIIASPLGLRTSIEDQKNADFLSSIEIVIAEQLDVMLMQNWEHVQFVFERLNGIPKEAHGADFSRVKPWYLDGQAAHLRQTILLSAYETPEIRHLFNKQLSNVAGKVESVQSYEGVLHRIKPGVKQTFFRFDTQSIQKEDDARFQYFTQKTLPALRKSAVASQNTLIFIPSYFDFVRVNAYLKELDDFSYAVLSEYSSNSEISRARTNFFNGKKSFLVVTERFHFFRRYKIRGARTVVFYAPPEHADFYAEYLEYPFLTREVSASSKNRPDAAVAQEVLEPADVTCQAVFSKYDYLRLERVVGSEDARRMCHEAEGERFSFV